MEPMTSEEFAAARSALTDLTFTERGADRIDLALRQRESLVAAMKIVCTDRNLGDPTKTMRPKANFKPCPLVVCGKCHGHGITEHSRRTYGSCRDCSGTGWITRS